MASVEGFPPHGFPSVTTSIDPKSSVRKTTAPDDRGFGQGHDNDRAHQAGRGEGWPAHDLAGENEDSGHNRRSHHGRFGADQNDANNHPTDDYSG